MTPGYPRICLNMIVRNEAHCIKRMLDSVVDHIHGYVIVDTGSTDDTIKIINDTFRDANIPGYVDQIEFRNFEYARNQALEQVNRAPPGQFDYILLADADMELVVNNHDWTKYLHDKHRSFAMYQTGGGITYTNARLLAFGDPARYIGVTHEYLNSPTGLWCTIPKDDIYFVDHSDGSNRKDKFVRDIALLKEGLNKEPNNGRYWFYLGQSYRDSGDNKNAIDAYEKCISLSDWDEERWNARTCIAHCYKGLGNHAEFIRNSLLAYNMRPQRAEPLYDLAHFFRKDVDQSANSALFAEKGMSIPRPNDQLFVNDYVYDIGCKHEFGITGYYVDGKREKAFEACDSVYLHKGAYADARSEASANLFYYLHPLSKHAPSFRAQKIDFTPPETWRPLNPSITTHQDQLWCIVRTVNYEITETGSYAILGSDGSITNDNPINTRNFLLRLDKQTFRPEVVKEIKAPGQGLYKLVIGWEDMRLFSFGGLLNVSATVRENNAEGWCEQWRGLLLERGDHMEVEQACPMEYPVKETQKNWMPFPHGPRLDFMYRVDKMVDKDGKDEVKREAPFFCGNMSGSSQVIKFRGGFLALVHEAALLPGESYKRYYRHRFILFNPYFKAVRVSKPFCFFDKQIEFAAGMCEAKEDLLAISFGVRDKEAYIGTIEAEEVWNMLHD